MLTLRSLHPGAKQPSYATDFLHYIDESSRNGKYAIVYSLNNIFFAILDIKVLLHSLRELTHSVF
jgi:hypothetical protein